ncbi:MAG: hypothetical protein DCC58_00885 [Chloroflexi bacterium]|nr:MAG: hypothetical protein DCC58_00885 [Chloroflexota bacterium]
MKWLFAVASALLAGVASAGLFAATTNDLRPFAPLTMNAAWLLPGMIAIGILLATINSDGIWAAGAMAAAAVVAAVLHGSAIAAPGFAVEPIRTTMINNGTVQGLAAFLVVLIFGMIGVVAALVARSIIGHGDV